MERTLISWNVPNLITIPLMAFLGFIIVATLYQTALKFTGPTRRAGAAANGGWGIAGSPESDN